MLNLWIQSDLYKVLQPMAQGKVIQGIFNTQDASLHSALRRPISNIYSMSNLVEFEPYVDSTIRVLLRQLEEVQKDPDQAVDLGRWLQWFALDVMGEITFSKRLGFLDQGKDVDGIIQRILDLFKYASWVCTCIFPGLCTSPRLPEPQPPSRSYRIPGVGCHQEN